MEWKVLYVGSAHDASKDQTLDEILVGPIPVGINKFVLQADAPDPEQLPPDEILGVTVVLVTCSYRDREFIRVGYYVNNEYMNPEYQAAVAEAQQKQQQLEQQFQQQQQQKQQTEAATAAKTNAGGGGSEGNGSNDEDDDDDQQEQQEPPTVQLPTPPKYPQLDLNQVQRQILADKPRVTKFSIPWTDDAVAAAAAAGQQDGEGGDAEMAVDETQEMLKDGLPQTPDLEASPPQQQQPMVQGSPMQM